MKNQMMSKSWIFGKDYKIIVSKKMTIIFLITIAIVFLGIYATCGTLYKDDCHEVLLRKFPRGF